MRNVIASIVLAAPLALTPVAHADRIDGPNAHKLIERGDYSAAERKLLADAKIFPNRPEVLLNLAAIYTKTGRPMEARALYNRVMALESVAMDTPDGKIAGSHLIAGRGMRQLEAAQMAAR